MVGAAAAPSLGRSLLLSEKKQVLEEREREDPFANSWEEDLKSVSRLDFRLSFRGAA